MVRRLVGMRRRDWFVALGLASPVAVLLLPVLSGLFSAGVDAPIRFADENGVWLTVAYAFTAALLQTFFGVLIGCWMYEGAVIKRPWWFLWWVLLLIPYGVPSMVTAELWRSLGVLIPNWTMATLAELVLASAWQFTPFAALLVYLFLSRNAGRMRKLALSDGFGEFQRIRLVYIPYLVDKRLVAALLAFRFVLMFGKYDLPELLTFHAFESLTTMAFRRSLGGEVAALVAVFFIAMLAGLGIFAALLGLSRARWVRAWLTRKPARGGARFTRVLTGAARYFVLLPTVYALIWWALPSAFIDSFTLRSLEGYSFTKHVISTWTQLQEQGALAGLAALTSFSGASAVALLCALVAFGAGMLALRCREEVNILVYMAWTCAYASPTTLLFYWWCRLVGDTISVTVSYLWLFGVLMVALPLSVVVGIWMAGLIPAQFQKNVRRDGLTGSRWIYSHFAMLSGCAFAAAALAFLVAWGDYGMSIVPDWVGAPRQGTMARLMSDLTVNHPSESNSAVMRCLGSIGMLVPALFSAIAVCFIRRQAKMTGP
jgi:ABC-type sugar transport system permease subunit